MKFIHDQDVSPFPKSCSYDCKACAYEAGRKAGLEEAASFFLANCARYSSATGLADAIRALKEKKAMNGRLVQFARAELKSGLAQLPDGWKMNFKRMYSDGDLDLELDDIVDGIPEEKLDWALSQVQNSIKKLKP